MQPTVTRIMADRVMDKRYLKNMASCWWPVAVLPWSRPCESFLRIRYDHRALAMWARYGSAARVLRRGTGAKRKRQRRRSTRGYPGLTKAHFFVRETWGS